MQTQLTNQIHDRNKHIEPLERKLLELLEEVLEHDGFGDIHVEIKILKRKQKEVIIHCGKQYRFVVDVPMQ